MSFPRVLVTSCRELLTLAPRVPYAAHTRREPRHPGRTAALGAVAALLSLTLWAVWTYLGRRDMWHMLDLSVYHDAAESISRGDSHIYTGNFGNWSDGGLPFIYPPISGHLFHLLLPLGFAGLKWLMAVVNLLALFTVVWAAWGMLGYRRGLGRLGLSLAAFSVVLWLEPVEWTLVWGQVNLLLMALIMADLAQPDSRRWKGVGVGVAAGLKLTPAIFIVYLLITRRFRAAAVSVGALAATIVVGWIGAPEPSAYYWANVVEISGKVNDKLSVGTLNNQSVQGMFTRMLGDGTATTVLWLLGCLIVGGLGMLAAAKASLRGDELVGVVLTGTLALFVSPISWSHHWVWVVPGLVLIAHAALTRGRRLWWALTGGFFVFFAAWPLRLDVWGDWDGGRTLQPWGLIWLAPRDGGRERHWTPVEFVLGNGYLLAGIALVLLVSWRVLRDTTALPVSPAPPGSAGSPESGAPTSETTPETTTGSGTGSGTGSTGKVPPPAREPVPGRPTTPRR